ncbi:MAG: hypothetical protein ABIF87_04275 [Pseudomonadota bacterium]
MSDRHAKKELAIFSDFAKAVSLPVMPGTTEKRLPPEPDILCQVHVEGTIAFELVQLIDPEFARRFDLLLKTKTGLRHHYESLPQDGRIAFQKAFGNALLYFKFEEDASLRQRLKSLELSFRLLLRLQPAVEGEVLKNEKRLKGILKGVHITRGDFSGPIFDPESFGAVGDPTRKEIDKKFQKRYKTQHPVELLAYIDIHPMFPDDIWLPGVSKFVKENLKGSVFRKTWVYDVHNKSVRYEYPER